MPNIHTYTALINTCIKSGDYTLALDVFGTLKVPALKDSLASRKERKSLRREAFPPCLTTWLMGGLG